MAIREDEDLLFRGLPGAEKLRKLGRKLDREKARKEFWRNRKKRNTNDSE